MHLTLTLSTKVPGHMAGAAPQQVSFKGGLSTIMAEAFDQITRAKNLGIFDAGGCVNIVIQLDRPELFHART